MRRLVRAACLRFPHGGSFSIQSIVSELLQTIPAGPATSLPVPHRCLCFYVFLFGSCSTSSRACRRLHLLRVFAGLGVELSRIESSDTDVDAALSAQALQDPVDKPGTTMGTQFSVLHGIFLAF